MEQNKNTAIIKECYDAFGRGDIKTILSHCADDVDWEAVVGVGNRIPTGGRRRGLREVEQFFQNVSELVDYEQFQPREFIEQGNIVIALGHMNGTIKKTGRKYQSDWVMTFRMRNNKVVEFREYSNSAALLEAYGINLGQPAATEARPRPGADRSH